MRSDPISFTPNPNQERRSKQRGAADTKLEPGRRSEPLVLAAIFDTRFSNKKGSLELAEGVGGTREKAEGHGLTIGESHDHGVSSPHLHASPMFLWGLMLATAFLQGVVGYLVTKPRPPRPPI